MFIFRTLEAVCSTNRHSQPLDLELQDKLLDLVLMLQLPLNPVYSAIRQNHCLVELVLHQVSTVLYQLLCILISKN